VIIDESGFICICGQWVDGVMHGECRSLMTTEQYERWSSKVQVVSSRGDFDA
jgi:hypothetical protein